jgi:hypothetical protein
MYCNVQPEKCLLALVKYDEDEVEQWRLMAPFGVPSNFNLPTSLVFVLKADLDMDFMLFQLPNNEWIGTVKIELYEN